MADELMVVDCNETGESMNGGYVDTSARNLLMRVSRLFLSFLLISL